MTKCPNCGYERTGSETRCNQCGSYYQTIRELLDAEEEYELANSFRGRWQKILQSDHKKQAILAELGLEKGLTRLGKFTLYVIIAFVFILTLSVL